VLGIGSAATLVLAPLTGVLSDRTRSRWGRRRPFTVLGVLLGLAAVPVMAFASNLLVLTLGWVLSTVGWSTTAGSIANWQADRLPPSQRGRISGLTGLTMQISPVVGILLVGLVRESTILVFLLPAGLGAGLVAAFVLAAPEEQTHGRGHPSVFTARSLLSSYLFHPRHSPDFAWNWLGRFVFFMGLSLTTSFTVFFYAQRLDLAVPDVAGVMAVTSALSIVSATIGSLWSGWLSDRLGRRQPLVLAGTLLFATGAGVSAFAHDFVTLVVGTLISSLGVAVFTAAGQALNLDVLPDRDTQAGRYMAITTFSQKIPGVVAPVAAPALLLLGAGSNEQNFVLLYVCSAILAVVGGVIIAAKVRGTQ